MAPHNYLDFWQTPFSQQTPITQAISRRVGSQRESTKSLAHDLGWSPKYHKLGNVAIQAQTTCELIEQIAKFHRQLKDHMALKADS